MQITKEEQEGILQFLTDSEHDFQHFVVNMFGESERMRPIQLEFAEKFKKNQRVTFRGGTGFGKTRGVAYLVWWALFVVGSLHGETKITIFAPTDATLKTGLANEIRSLYNKMPEWAQASFELTAEKIERKTNGADCVCYFRTVNKDNPSANAGIHARNNFIIVDEATGVDDVVFEQALLNHLNSDVNPKIALIANPRYTSGYFWRTWNDHTISGLWAKVHGRMRDNPNVTDADIEAKAREFGRLSNEYRYTVEGEFPDSDENSLIGRVLVELAMDNTDAEPSHKQPIIWGVDPAGPGKDRSVLLKRHDNVVFDDPKQWNGLTITQLSYTIRDLYQAEPPSKRPAVIAVDANGLGRGLADNLMDWGLPIKAVVTQSSPTRGEGKRLDGGGMYSRLRDQLWWEVKEWFATENVRIPKHDELAKELTVPSYWYETNGRIKVEGKKEIKKRLKKSPDFADALCLTFAVSSTRYASKFSWSNEIDYGDLRWAE